MSSLPDDAVVAAGQGMQGSPAEPDNVDLERLQDGEPARRGSAFLLGLVHLGLIYVMGYLLILSILPAVALIGAGLYFGGPGLGAAAAIIAAPISTLWYLALVLAVKRLAIGRILPGVYRLNTTAYLRYWFLSYLLNNTRHMVLALYATLFLPKFLRLLGAKIGRGAEISTAMHIMPDLLDIGEGSFLADACIVGGHKIHLGRIELCANKIGIRSFVGNSALIPAGIDVGDNSLIGVMSTPPAGVTRTADGTRWLGSPGFELPNTQHIDCFSSKLTFEPGRGLVLGRVVVEAVRLFLPGIVTTANFVVFCIAMAVAYQHAPLWGVVLLAPATAFVLSFWSILVVALVKVVLVDRFEPTVKPLWCSFVWLNEVVNGLYESVAATAMAPLMGTPFISPCLRLMGCRIGKWVFLETTLFSEFDLVEIGDHAALNLGATIQTHLFEDRVMKADHLRIGEGCSVGNMAVVLYGTEMKRGSSLGALSVLMKGEVVPAFSRWMGIPTRPVEASASVMARSTALAPTRMQTASREHARSTARRRVRKELLMARSNRGSRRNHKIYGAFLQDGRKDSSRRGIRSGLIYSVGIAAVLCVIFIDAGYYGPLRPIASLAGLQPVNNAESEKSAYRESEGLRVGHAAEQIEGTETPAIPPPAQSEPWTSSDGPLKTVVAATNMKMKPDDEATRVRTVETRLVRVWTRSRDSSEGGSQSFAMKEFTVEHEETDVTLTVGSVPTGRGEAGGTMRAASPDAVSRSRAHGLGARSARQPDHGMRIMLFQKTHE